MESPRLAAPIELHSTRTFADGLMLELIDALRRTPAGGLFALEGPTLPLADELESWSRMTGNVIVSRTRDGDSTRWVIRHGAPAASSASPAQRDERKLGARLWLYTNFDCNLSCDYCCVRSSPTAPRRALGLEAITRIAAEAPALGVREIFVTGGEPMLLDDIAEILRVLSQAAPVTVLTNGALLKGARHDEIVALDRSRLTLQISLDSPDPSLHDLHRGKGTWARALRGADAMIAAGFRVRLAATVSTDEEERRFVAFLDERGVAAEDRVVRRVALRGSARDGVPLARVDMMPEITITAEGVFWHPVGAADSDLLLTREIFPLAKAFEEAARAAVEERKHGDALQSVFHCA